MLRSPYEGHAIAHRSTQHAAESARLVVPAHLSAAKDGLYPHMANFLCALGILSALQATQSGEQLVKVLIPNAVRLGGEGPAVASSMRDWVAWADVGNFLTMADMTHRLCGFGVW